MSVKKDTLTYYDRVIVTLQSGFSNDEDKELFLNNVLEQFSQEASEVCKDYSISVCLEELLRQCSQHHLVLFFSHISNSLSTLIQHKIASHVVQQLLTRLTALLADTTEDQIETIMDNNNDEDDGSSDNDDDDDDDDTKNCKVIKIFLGLCKYCLKNMKVCFENQYCCQVLRTMLEIIGGVDKYHCVERRKLHKQKKGKGKSEVSEVNIEVPLSTRMKLKRLYKAVTCKITSKIYKHFKNMTYISNHINLLLQTSLKIEYDLDPALCNKHCRKLAVVLGLDEPISEDSLPTMFENTDQQFLFETIIQCAGDELSEEIYKKLFQHRLLKFALHKRANYSLKAMINCIKQEQFIDLYDEIEMNLEEIVNKNPMFNICDILATGCLQFRCSQARFIKQLTNILHCSVPEERKIMLVPLIIKWQNYEEFFSIQNEEDAEERICIDSVPLDCVSKNGSFLLQKLFKFGSNKMIIDSLLNIETEDLCRLATSKLGGFVIQAFCESSTNSQKVCDAFCDKFKGSLAKIACDQWGSRAIEDIYKCVSTNMKYTMAEELSYFLRRLQNDIYGHFVCRKLALYHFLHRRSDWQAIQNNDSRKRKLFKDIIGDMVIPEEKKEISNSIEDDSDSDTQVFSLF
ncbi:hypothetical protein LOTGIDRAFT_234897 [Lottia gigantea]|uniref:PUM-HD domain-containing protein n=1 Tax=Lottia gigantea TaxID=225164 RepID=V3ZU85_LOTGI|nr:hypothetical protein LOTGIDRAFT_234897 [Lottia gigantea]ESO87917.1 hypothetical protein LOTGIDRAFT_234897 [Lottia gigantea]